MTGNATERVREKVEAVYRSESRRILATLIRLLGDFDLAEDALHDAFTAALEQWPNDGVPANPRAWLVSTGRFKAIDASAGAPGSTHRWPAIAEQLTPEPVTMRGGRGKHRGRPTRLIFICCHPALAPDARIALTLREVCGLTTERSRGFPYGAVDAGPAHRARQGEIRDARIPYQCRRQQSCRIAWRLSFK